MMENNLHINKFKKSNFHMIYILISMKYVGKSICCFFFVVFLSAGYIQWANAFLDFGLGMRDV